MSDERTQLIAQFKVGWLECGRRQSSIMVQLGAMMTELRAVGGEPGSGGKPKSKPPMDLSVMDLYYECAEEVAMVIGDELRDLGELNRLRARARQVLGYDVRMVSLPSVVCHQCGGPLVVAEDASSSVTCAERCGVEYPHESWLDILAHQGAGEA